MLGQLKASVIILGGWLFFSQSYPPKALAGAGVAIGAIVLYTHFNLKEQSSKVLAVTAVESAAPKGPLDEDTDCAGQQTPLMARRNDGFTTSGGL